MTQKQWRQASPYERLRIDRLKAQCPSMKIEAQTDGQLWTIIGKSGEKETLRRTSMTFSGAAANFRAEYRRLEQTGGLTTRSDRK
jgi:hypothetical protein